MYGFEEAGGRVKSRARPEIHISLNIDGGLVPPIDRKGGLVPPSLRAKTMSDVLVARIGKNVDRDDVVQAFIISTAIESAAQDFMTSLGYAEDEYELSQGDRDEMMTDLNDREIWYIVVTLEWGKASLPMI